MNQPVRSIIVVRVGAMGDILFTTPLLRALRLRYPGAHITYACLKKWRFLVAANPHIDAVFPLTCVHPRAVQALRHKPFDLLINLQEGEAGAQIAQAIAARERRGNQWREERVVPDAKTGICISREKADRQEQCKQGLSFAEQFGLVSGVALEDLHYDFFPSARARRRAMRFLRRQGLLQLDQAIVALHICSGGSSARSWKAEQAREVVRAMPECQFLLLGFRRDRPALEMLLPEPNVAVSWDPIEVQAAMLTHCSLFLGIDSGPRYVASAMGIPIVWLCGPTPANLMPPRENERSLSVGRDCAPCCEDTCAGGKDCLAQIPADRIVAASRGMLRRLA